nr:ATP synthase F0 subunit 8 [Humbertiella nada]
MPQMMPLWWVCLFIMFILLLIMISIMCYYAFYTVFQSNMSYKKQTLKPLIWKW